MPSVADPMIVIEDSWETDTHRCNLIGHWVTDEAGCDVAESWSIYVDEGFGAWKPHTSVNIPDERVARSLFLTMEAIATGSPLPTVVQSGSLQELRDWMAER